MNREQKLRFLLERFQVLESRSSANRAAVTDLTHLAHWIAGIAISLDVAGIKPLGELVELVREQQGLTQGALDGEGEGETGAGAPLSLVVLGSARTLQRPTTQAEAAEPPN